ncbi:MAG: hypothetical protein U9N42_05680 [Campylobacterota bacterium]|nr:hypothetical protein [Campylobacterota bacterium]
MNLNLLNVVEYVIYYGQALMQMLATETVLKQAEMIANELSSS